MALSWPITMTWIVNAVKCSLIQGVEGMETGSQTPAPALRYVIRRVRKDPLAMLRQQMHNIQYIPYFVELSP